MTSPDYYLILGVSESAGIDEIKASFRKLALQYHPDRNPGNREAIEIFSGIKKAYETLSDSDKRREYDLKRHKGKPENIFTEMPVRSVVDRAKIRIAVDKRVVMPGEPVLVVISIFENNSRIVVKGLPHFDVAEGPVINSAFPVGRDYPEVEITYLLKPKYAGYLEIGPASFISNGLKYLSDSVYIKVNPPPGMVRFRKPSMLEKIQSAAVSTLIVFYSFLIGYNIYQFKIWPYRPDDSGYVSRSPAPISLGLHDLQLSTGAIPYMRHYGRGTFDFSSMNRIRFRNGKSYDAVVMLTDIATQQTIRNNYIRAGDDFVMQNIPDGSYYLKVLFGNDWNSALCPLNDEELEGGFNRNVRYEIFRQDVNVIQMKHSRSGDTLGYKIYEITLYPVPDGNAQSHTAAPREFF